MRGSSVNDSNHLRERAVEMRASSKELKDDNTAALIMRLADLYDRLADRAETRWMALAAIEVAVLGSICWTGTDGPRYRCHSMAASYDDREDEALAISMSSPQPSESSY